MPAHQHYKTPIPIFVPTLSVAAVLLVLFLVGQREQNALIDDRVEQVIRQHEIIARIVADNMDSAIRQTRNSVQRYSKVLSARLDQNASTANRSDLEQWVEQTRDGSYRSIRNRFDPAQETGLWIPASVTLDNDTRWLFATVKQITDVYGLGAVMQPFVNSWVLFQNGGVAVFWPEQPSYIFNISADVNYGNTDWVQLTTPARNPQREVRWTSLSFDPVSQLWVMSAVAPVYRNNQWVGAAGHDLPLDNLLQRTQLLRQSQDSYFVLVTVDKRIVASARYAERIKASLGTLRLGDLQDATLNDAIALATPHLQQQPFQRLRIRDNEVFVAEIPQQDWLLVNVIPLEPVASQVQLSFLNMRNIALVALIAELLIATLLLAWSHHRSRRQFEHLADMQQQLARSEHHFRTLVDNIPGIVYRCKKDASWTMLYISNTVEKFTGYPAEDFINNHKRSFASILHPEDRVAVEAMVDNALERNRPFVLEYRIVTRDGRELQMLEHGQCTTLEGESVDELQGVILDITALKQAETQLKHLNDSLEWKVEFRTAELRSAINELESFNYVVAHDLKAPVRQISGFLEAIADDMPVNVTPEVREHIKRCQKALHRMKEMIASLHAYSQLSRDSLHPEKINVNNLLDAMLKQLPGSIRQRFHFEFAPLDDVVADRTLLRIVLHHLLDNAIKFTAHAQRPTIKIIDHSTSAEWMLEIKDNGVGFNPSYETHLFQIFQRLHSQEAFPGFGVGLALVRKILQLHDGSIRAESQPDQGASFFISIPVRAIHSQRPAVSAAL